MASAPPSPGSYTLEEILSQPRCWTECLQALEENNQIGPIHDKLSLQSDWLFIGCGSSYYVAQSAAASWTILTGRHAHAIPASELLLFPRLVLRGSTSCQPVLISRSGRTSEILSAAEYLERKEKIRPLAISCAAHSALEGISLATLHLAPAEEKSMVMTRSFTSMLLGLEYLAADLCNNTEFQESLRKAARLSETLFDTLPSRIEGFVEANDFADYVFLGQGPYYGLACEGMLKVKEMSCSYAQCFHTLEFRHGPKSIVGPETLIAFLLSESGYAEERKVLEEVKALGGATLVVTNRADDTVRRAADFLVELHLEVPENARLAPFALAGQLLGLYTGLKKGYDPDRPRHLSPVVILAEKS